jgi:hypothetical protein
VANGVSLVKGVAAKFSQRGWSRLELLAGGEAKRTRARDLLQLDER